MRQKYRKLNNPAVVLFHLDIFQKPMYNVFMAQDYDNMAKNLLSEYATGISQFVLGVNDVEVLENIDTEQQIVIGQRTSSTTAASVDQQTRGDLLCAISLFGSIVYDAQLFKRLIQAELMQESKYYQLLREEFMAEGARETTIKHIIVLLKTKFTADAVSALTPNIQKINDLQRLEQLYLAAAQAKSLEAFKQIIQE